MRMSPKLLALLSLLLLAPATAQDPSRYVAPSSSYLPPPWCPDGYFYHSSTYEEGVQRGFADVVRSRGLANMYNSAAAINWEQARRKNMENRVYGTETYFQLREYNREARAAERGPRPSTEDLIRYAKQGRPQSLSDSELDPLLGSITWPDLLRADTFAGQRKTLETLFVQRASLGGLNTEQAMQAAAAVEEMRADLKKGIKNYPSGSYLTAKKFLDSLAFAAYQRST